VAQADYVWSSGDNEIREKVKSGEETVGGAYRELKLGPASKPHVSHNTGEHEWYTPSEYIQAAREAMGGIDCDPATSNTANKIVGATTFFTVEDDGLGKEWIGRVWMNPPYSQPAVRQFCDKLRDEYSAGRATQACVLINNATETVFFQELASLSSAICFPRGRLRFVGKDGETSGTPLQGQAILYLGSYPTSFSKAFNRFGLVVIPWASAV
jgi:ParB family chromosome partitioning protein